MRGTNELFKDSYKVTIFITFGVHFKNLYLQLCKKFILWNFLDCKKIFLFHILIWFFFLSKYLSWMLKENLRSNIKRGCSLIDWFLKNNKETLFGKIYFVYFLKYHRRSSLHGLFYNTYPSIFRLALWVPFSLILGLENQMTVLIKIIFFKPLTSWMPGL